MCALHRLLFVLMLGVVSGCTALSPRTEVITYGAGFPSEALSGNEALSWHAIRFRMPFEADGSVNWDMDLLLAHGVLGMLIAEHRDQLPLWRFHRRAAPDQTGHQLSLLFYADSPTAEALFQWMEGDPLLQAAQKEGAMTDVRTQLAPFADASSLSATSDQSWHPAIQKQWPSFIMGVSATWLGLIEELLPAAEGEHETLTETLARYHSANDALTALWREQGQHAFLHHLNALFGYEPMLIKRYMRF